MSKPIFSLAGRRIWVAGHTGMVGGAVVRRLRAESCETITIGRAEVDLRRQQAVERWMAKTRSDVVVFAAATVGGILANDSRPVDFLYENLMIESNIINAARINGVSKLLFLGSSCIYPRLAPQPMREEALLTGPLEPPNQWYAVAKIAGLISGKVMRVTTPSSLEPRVFADSSRTGSMFLRAAAMMRKARGVRISPSTKIRPGRE